MSSAPRLNLSDREIEHAGKMLTEFLRSYEKSLPALPVLPSLDRDVLSDLLLRPFPEDGIGIDQLFQEITGKVVPNSTAIAHPPLVQGSKRPN